MQLDEFVARDLGRVQMAEEYQPRMISPTSVADAAKILSELGEDARILAGGTWIMRAPIRGEVDDKVFVSLGNIEALNDITLGSEKLSIGAMATHHGIAEALDGTPDLNVLKQAALASANPSIRRMATIGGNICTTDFLSPDLVPALIASDATLTFQLDSGVDAISIEEYIETRAARPVGGLLTLIQVPRGSYRSAHQRLLMRQAGEYAVANLSMRYGVNRAGLLEGVRIAVGSVEDVPKRWWKLERALDGKAPPELDITAIAKEHLDQFSGRDGPDAPGWYRTRVLPRLASDAFDATTKHVH